MKRTFLLFLILSVSVLTFAESFVMIKVENQQNLQEVFQRSDLRINYYNDNFVLATADEITDEMIVLDDNAFKTNSIYSLIYCASSKQDSYLEREKNNAELLFRSDDFVIVKPLSGNLLPAKNDGMVNISNKTAKLPVLHRDFPVLTEENPDIRFFIDQVDKDSLRATVQHLQDYQTRIYNTPQSQATAEWIYAQFEALGLEVEYQDFTYQGQQSSPNVIAIQRGTVYPDEYVVCGSHHDSYVFSGNMAPGADDNATGVAAVLESARILSQYQFERSIIYCSFSAEEVGLVGSAEYASRCRQENMDIIGYFNNDMNGYLYGDEIHIDCIYPSNVEPIGEYYRNVGGIYFPEMEIRHESFMSGDSDHTSFNQNGYMGIYPFEDTENYSPYIHSSADTIGLSVNSFEMSQRYTQMNMACLAEIANPLPRGPIVVDGFEINDEEGNNDGKLNPGETIMLTVTLKNTSESIMSDVTIILEEPNSNEFIDIIEGEASCGNFASGEIKTIENAFVVSLSEDAPGNVFFRLLIRASSGTESCDSYINLESYDYIMSVAANSVMNETGLLTPGETTDLRVYVENAGNEMAFGLHGVLSSISDKITINENEAEFGTIGVEDLGYGTFNITLSEQAEISDIIPFSLNLTDSEGKVSVIEFEYKNACNVVFTLNDSYGDSWNGAYITVIFDDGTPSVELTCNGSQTVEVLEITTGVTVSLEWHSGQWDSECSYKVEYEDGETIFEGEEGESGIFFTWENNCSNGGSIPTICAPVENLTAEVETTTVSLSWDAPSSDTPDSYDVYRETVFLGNTEELSFVDEEVSEGSYYYCVYAVYSDCQSSFECIDVIFDPSGVDENMADKVVSFYPNPAHNTITFVSSLDNKVEMQIVNMVGQVVNRFMLNGSVTVDLSDFNNGVYFVKSMSDNNTIQKLIINK